MFISVQKQGKGDYDPPHQSSISYAFTLIPKFGAGEK